MKRLFFSQDISTYDSYKFYSTDFLFCKHLKEKYSLIIKDYQWLYSLEERNNALNCKGMTKIDNQIVILEFQLSVQYNEENSKFTVKYYPLSELQKITIQDRYDNKGFSLSFMFSGENEEFISEEEWFNGQKGIIDFAREIMKNK